MKISERQVFLLLMIAQDTTTRSDYQHSVVGGMTKELRQKLVEQILTQISDTQVDLADPINVDITKFNP